jgi:putative mRNA 3-end processing factor
MQLRFKKSAGANFSILRYRQEFLINGVKLKFIPAGHILGSAQVLMEFDGTKYLYTGDIKIQEDATCEPVEWEQADVLITETTFANPNTKHPSPETEMVKLNSHNHNVLLGAYSLGKSQRLINLLNRYCPQRKVLVHHSILPINKIYEDYSFAPGVYEPYNRKLMKSPDQGFVYIVPPLTFNSYFRAKNVVRVFASGWENLQTQNQTKLFISDHVDWDDILEMIKQVKPREVWTLHGDGRALQAHFADTLPVKILPKC